MSTRDEVAEAAFLAVLIGITIGAFVRVFRLTIRIPVVAYDMYCHDFRPHFMYYPTVAFTVAALMMILIFGIHGHPWMILHGLFLGWLAGDFNYYSNKWVSSRRWISWCPGLGYRDNDQIVRSRNERYYISLLGVTTAALTIVACAPAFDYFRDLIPIENKSPNWNAQSNELFCIADKFNKTAASRDEIAHSKH